MTPESRQLNGVAGQLTASHSFCGVSFWDKSKSYSGSKHDPLSPRRAQDSTERAGNLVGTLPPPAINANPGRRRVRIRSARVVADRAIGV